MSLKRSADPLRFIAVRLGLPEVEQIAREPGVGEAYRVTVQYHDARHPDQVATLVFRQGAGGTADLTVCYRRSTAKPLILKPKVPLTRCREFASTLRRLHFDGLDDMPDVPWYGQDLWLVERASGSFEHDIVVAPALASGVHAEIVALVRSLLHEAVRAIG